MKKTFTFLFIFILAVNITGLAQSGIFMQISDPSIIPGESLSTSHPNWIDIQAFQGGGCATVTFSPGPGGTQPNDATTGDFTFTTLVNKTTAHFKTQMYTRSDIGSLVVEFERNISNSLLVYYKIQMENAYVTSVTEAGNNADGRPLCNITLSPRRFRYTYYPTGNNGPSPTNFVFGWDRTTTTIW